jgi:hypothetical protein
MTDEPNVQPEPESFAEFEARAKAPDAVPEAKAEPAKDDTLELGGADAPQLTEEQKAEAEKNRSRHPSQRIAHYRAVAGEAERERDAARAELAALRGGGKAPAPATEQEPRHDDKNEDGTDKYEFGEADPAFTKDLARYEGRQAYREERQKEAEEGKKNAAQQEVVGKLHDGMAAIEKTGPEKYEDFEAKINEAVEARGGEPLHPMVSIGIAVSPAGADIAYRLATDEAAATKIEKLAQTNPRAAAMEFGELEGQYLDNEDDADLDLNDPLDMARMIGRERARRKGLTKGAAVERKVTKAPEPAEHRSRGANGQFDTRADTSDFGAFEKMANRKA